MKSSLLGGLLLGLTLAVGSGVPATAAPVVPVPPEYVQDKQLPGEDPFSIEKPAFSPDNRYVAAFMHGSKKLTVWDTKTGQVVKEFGEDVHKMDSLDGLEWSKDGKLLILLRNSQPVRYVDSNSGKMAREVAINADSKKILDYAFNAEQTQLACGTYDGIKLYDMGSGKLIKHFVPGNVISGLDRLDTTDRQGRPVHLLAYGRFLTAKDHFKGVAGLINIDSGKITPLLDDIPAAQKIEGKMTIIGCRFEWGGSHLLVTDYVIPPSTKAEAYLIDTWTGKYVANQSLGQKTVDWYPRYLGKPFYGFVIPTWDGSDPVGDWKSAAQFLVPTAKNGFQVLDTVDEKKLPMQSIATSRNSEWAVITLKKNQADPSKIFLYHLVPKKK